MSFLGFSKKKEKEKGAQEPLPETQTVSDLMRGLQYSVNAAQQVLERHHLYLLGKYIDNLGRPKTQRIRLNDSKVVDIPRLAYMNQCALGIDELELAFSAKVENRMHRFLIRDELGIFGERNNQRSRWLFPLLENYLFENFFHSKRKESCKIIHRQRMFFCGVTTSSAPPPRIPGFSFSKR